MSEHPSFHPPLAGFVARLRAAHDQFGPDGVRDLVENLQPDVSSMDEWIRVRRGRYTRTLVHRDEDFEVLLIAWAPGARSPIHDHAGQACWMRTLVGEVEVINYRLLAGGKEPGPATIEFDGDPRVLGPGQLDRPTERAPLHAVRTADGSPWALTLHVYMKPIDTCLVFDPRTQRCERRRLRYDFEGPARFPERSPENPPRESFWASASRTARELLDRARQASAQLLSPSQVPDREAQLHVQALSHVYPGNIEALRNVSLNIRSGEFVCLLGPSGCGKSTVLYALAGHVKPSGGILSIDGRPITGPGPDRLLMFQDAALFPWMTAEQNITFVLAARGVPREERKARARTFLHHVQLDGFEDAMPHQLSGGMKMRLSLARALAVDAPVLLMDEPFGSLDVETRLQMNELLHRLWREGQKTIVFVTHDVNEAVLLGSRVVLMAKRPGRIIADLDLALGEERDPEDLQLSTLAAEIRRKLKAGSDHAKGDDAVGDTAAVHGGRGDRLGADEPDRSVAPLPVPGSPGRR